MAIRLVHTFGHREKNNKALYVNGGVITLSYIFSEMADYECACVRNDVREDNQVAQSQPCQMTVYKAM